MGRVEYFSLFVLILAEREKICLNARLPPCKITLKKLGFGPGGTAVEIISINAYFLGVIVANAVFKTGAKSPKTIIENTVTRLHVM